MLRFSIWLLIICGSIGQAQKCIESRNITGHCSKFQVAVNSNAPEIKAKLFIAPGKHEFNDSMTVDNGNPFPSPNEIVASQYNMTMKQKGGNPQTVCSTAPFTLTDGKVTTTVGLKINRKVGANLVLDDSPEFVKTDIATKPKNDGPDVGLICGIVGGVVLIFIALALFIGGCCCWCKKDKRRSKCQEGELDVKKMSQKKSVTAKSTRPTPVPMVQPKASME
ncbi:hypothetical protein M3Y96_00996500 [Aphelenchoides besseyi]|nr:hypothetical protein M3Y96_00996500 [Aphelenchoides besseyi]